MALERLGLGGGVANPPSPLSLPSFVLFLLFPLGGTGEEGKERYEEESGNMGDGQKAPGEGHQTIPGL